MSESRQLLFCLDNQQLCWQTIDQTQHCCSCHTLMLLQVSPAERAEAAQQALLAQEQQAQAKAAARKAKKQKQKAKQSQQASPQLSPSTANSPSPGMPSNPSNSSSTANSPSPGKSPSGATSLTPADVSTPATSPSPAHVPGSAGLPLSRPAAVQLANTASADLTRLQQDLQHLSTSPAVDSPQTKFLEELFCCPLSKVHLPVMGSTSSKVCVCLQLLP